MGLFALCVALLFASACASETVQGQLIQSPIPPSNGTTLIPVRDADTPTPTSVQIATPTSTPTLTPTPTPTPTPVLRYPTDACVEDLGILTGLVSWEVMLSNSCPGHSVTNARFYTITLTERLTASFELAHAESATSSSTIELYLWKGEGVLGPRLAENSFRRCILPGDGACWTLRCKLHHRP